MVTVRKAPRLLALALLALLAALPPAPARAAASVLLPPGFASNTVVTGLRGPTDMAFLANGDILISQKGEGVDTQGRASVRYIRAGVLQAAPVVTIGVNTHYDSGMHAIAADPAFAANGYFYVYYTTGQTSLGWSGEPKNRLSRFTFNAQTGTANPASELILLDNLPWGEMHHGGAMIFDDQGHLYLATGDASSFNLAQNLGSFHGKLLRLKMTAAGYEVPPDNPFVGTAGALPEIYAYGLRNPYRLARDPSTGRLLLADVGFTKWEEVNLVAKGVNYGWPEREGPCPRGQGQPCKPADPKFTDPMIAYPHPATGGEVGSAVTGIAFVRGTGFPAAYRDQIFMADFNRRIIQRANPDAPPVTVEEFASSIGDVVDFEYRPEGLYTLDVYSGKLSLIFHTASDNQRPVAQLSANKTLGPKPLAVTFSAAGSSDPDGTFLRYEWTFGDDTDPVVTDVPSVAHTYADDGNYTASLLVSDVRGDKSSAATLPITVYSGEIPRIGLENLTSPGRMLFHGGDSFAYAAMRTAGTAGLDPAAPFTWDLFLHHNEHVHGVFTGQVAQAGQLEMDRDNHDGEVAIHYVLRLTMKSAAGINVVVERAIYPEIANLELRAEPEQVELALSGVQKQTPATHPAIVGTEYTLEAPAEVLHGRAIGEFAYWHVFNDWRQGFAGGPAAPEAILPSRAITLTVAVPDTIYVAHYDYSRTAEMNFLPVVGK